MGVNIPELSKISKKYQGFKWQPYHFTATLHLGFFGSRVLAIKILWKDFSEMFGINECWWSILLYMS